jgi:hypothetical protein
MHIFSPIDLTYRIVGPVFTVKVNVANVQIRLTIDGLGQRQDQPETV